MTQLIEFEEVTVKDVYEALAQNGFKYIRGEWFSQDVSGVINGGCILGQGSLNLGVAADGNDYSLISQLDKFKVDRDSKWYEPGIVGTGNAIVYWNDKTIFSKKARKDVFALRTYKQVLKMAYDLLSPYFEETIKLRKRDFKYRRKDGTVNPMPIVGAELAFYVTSKGKANAST